jgi:hypothetical protein
MSIEAITNKTFTERPDIKPEEERKDQISDKSKQKETIERAEDVKASQYEHTAQVIATVEPEEEIRNTAREQLSKGYIDVKV